MTTAIMQSTHVTYQFSLTVNVNVNADKCLLLLFAIVALACWQMRRVGFELGLLWRDVAEAMSFTAKVFTIGFTALAFGLRVKI